MAAMNVVTGQAIPRHLDIYLVMDNGSSRTSRATRAWLAARPRFHVTRTPVHASWLNMAETFFILQRRLLRRLLRRLQRRLLRRLLPRGEFTSRARLAGKI